MPILVQLVARFADVRLIDLRLDIEILFAELDSSSGWAYTHQSWRSSFRRSTTRLRHLLIANVPMGTLRNAESVVAVTKRPVYMVIRAR